MGTAMQFWKEVEGVIDHQRFRGNEEPSLVGDKGHRERSQRYLRSWGIDYPYLKRHGRDEQRWLPVPEDSDVQRLMRSPRRIP
jgi:hypothetical protein